MAAISLENMGIVDIGRQGENLARIIEFDVGSLLQSWPDATITLLVKRRKDTVPYIAETVVNDGILRWTITSTETAVTGDGKFEIHAVSGDVVAKSVTGTFRVTSSLSGSASVELPEIRPSWVDRLLSAASELSNCISSPGKAHQHLVSDTDGKVVWEEKLAYKYTATDDIVVLPETLLLPEDEDGDGVNDMFLVPTPWTVDPVAGTSYKVGYNGSVYECYAVPYTLEGVPEGCVILGNAEMTGIEGGNPDVPFVFICVPNAVAVSMGMPFYGMGAVSDGADAVTLSISYTGEISTVKTIDEDLLPDNVKRTPITLTINSDGSITSDVSFAEAWKLSASQLQSVIAVKQTSAYKGECYATVDTVSKCSGAMSGYIPDFISIRFRKAWVDTSDLSDYDTTRVLNWSATDLRITATLGVLPYHDGGGTAYTGGYLRYKGNNLWETVTIDQLKADLGLTE